MVNKANLRPDAESYKGNFIWKDDFFGEKLGDRYLMLRTPPKDKWWKMADGTLTLRSTGSTIYEPNQPAFVGIRQQHLTFSAQIEMDYLPDSRDDIAGLVCYQREDHNFVFGKTIDGNGRYCLILKRAEGDVKTIVQAEIPSDAAQKAVVLKVEGNKDKYSFLYSFDEGETWMHKYNGKYYFSYSTGDTHFLCYAIGDNPYGPFTYKGVILTPVIGWTTHHSIVEYKGKWYLFHHDSVPSGGRT